MLFDYRLVTDAGGVAECRGSRYYPVDVSGILRLLSEHEGPVAVVGLPCVLKGIARARLANRGLAQRVTHLVAIACGQTKSTAYTEFLGSAMGLPSPVTSAEYRVKSPGMRSDSFRFRFKAGEESAD